MGFTQPQGAPGGVGQPASPVTAEASPVLLMNPTSLPLISLLCWKGDCPAAQPSPRGVYSYNPGQLGCGLPGQGRAELGVRA